MELRYPFVIIIGIIVIALVFVINIKRKHKYKTGVKIANTKFLKNSDEFKNIIKKYTIISTFSIVIVLFILLTSFVLISRPVKERVEDSTSYSRDIVLCMDVSGSVSKLNEDLVDNLKDVVKNMNGERFAISIFNTSSVLLVPLTDDYDHILNVLDTLKKAFHVWNSSEVASGYDFIYLSDYLTSGTLVGNEERGSSLISEGLASAAYSFPDIDEKRSRIIIFSTDNDLAGTSVLTLEEAAKICKSKNITVYSLAPSTIKNEDKIELEEATKLAGGKLYVSSKNENVSNIVNSIEEHEKSVVKGNKQVIKTDVPQTMFIVLVILVVIYYILINRVRI